jgi:hypothetical protein
VQRERGRVVELFELLQVAVLVDELARVEAQYPRGRLFGEERWCKKSDGTSTRSYQLRPVVSVALARSMMRKKMCVGLE